MKMNNKNMLLRLFCFLHVMNGDISYNSHINVEAHEDEFENITTVDIIDKLFTSYNKFSLPPMQDGGPHVVTVKVILMSVFDISDQSSSFTVRYVLSMYWNDTRLKFVPFGKNNNTITRITLPISFIKDKSKYVNSFLVFLLSLADVALCITNNLMKK